MAEDVLVKEVLTEHMIAAGRALVNTLEERGSSFLAAFWLYDWEKNRWKLTFAFPTPHKVSGAAIREVGDAQRATPEADFRDLYFMSPKDREVRVLQGIADRGIDIENRWHRGGFIEDSYIYRVRPTAAA